MALQFDGNGYVDSFNVTFNGDFSITMPSIEASASTNDEFYLAGAGAAPFLARVSFGTLVRFRALNSTSQVNVAYDSVNNPAYPQITLSRTSGVITLSVGGTSNTLNYSDPLTFTVIGAFNNNTFQSPFRMSGVMTIVGDSGGDVTFDFDNSTGTTLTDTTSGNNGTLQNFTTGGFEAASSPIANAGVDQSGLAAGDLVTLDGSGSSDPNSLVLTYQWTQTGGTAVTLSDSTAQSPTFTAPSLASSETLTFSLVVNNGTEDSAADSVDVGVLADASSQSFDIILLIGQSNMVGRTGPIDGVLDAQDSRVLQYGSTRQVLESAFDPLDHLDETPNTVGPGLSLAKHYADNYLQSGRKVLLVPAADGGTSFGTGFWQPGGTGYNNAIARANEAIALGINSRIVMMAWHQGESDSAMSESVYASNLDTLISGYRSSITGATDCPFIVGEINPLSAQYGAGVAAALLDTPNRVANTGYVETADLPLSGDNLHFTAVSSRALGVRYSQELNSIINSSSLTLNIGAPDGTYKTYLIDQSNNVVYSGNATFSGGSATVIGLAVVTGTALEGYVIDNESPHVNGAVITGVTV